MKAGGKSCLHNTMLTMHNNSKLQYLWIISQAYANLKQRPLHLSLSCHGPISSKESLRACYSSQFNSTSYQLEITLPSSTISNKKFFIYKPFRNSLACFQNVNWAFFQSDKPSQWLCRSVNLAYDFIGQRGNELGHHTLRLVESSSLIMWRTHHCWSWICANISLHIYVQYS